VISPASTKTTVEAISRVYINTQFAGGNVLVATGTTCDANGGIYALGNGHINMTNGGAYSRSCFGVTGSSTIFSKDHLITYSGQGTTSFMVGGSQIEYTGGNGLLFDGNAPVFIETDSNLTVDSGISYQLWSNNTPNPAIPLSKWPIPAAPSVTALTMQPPPTQSCPGPNRTPTINYQDTTISPGTYTNGITASSGALTLSPGVYCISAGQNVNFGGANVTADNTVIYFMGAGSFSSSSYGSTGVSMDNSSIYLTNGNFSISNGILTADNITIYIKQGNFSLSNGAHGVVMNAPGCGTACGSPPSIQGVLLYMNEHYPHTITVANGSSPGHQLNGTMYAPTALADFSGGTLTTTFDVQLIAQRIQVEQGAYLVMDTSHATLYSQGSTTIELLK
jgi:hypothetical protein